MKHVSTVFSYLLLLAGVVTLSWGILGFLEYFFGIAPLMPLQNPTFPPGTQFIHWFLITLSGSVYLLGYFFKWKYTPLAMIVIYAMLATMCFIQTFDFMTNPSRYTDFVRECIFYVIISAYLVRSRRMQTHFGRMEVNK
mgnify:CR=1 FL=1